MKHVRQLLIATVVLFVIAAFAAAQQQARARDTGAARGEKAAPATLPATKGGAVPAGVAGEWFWGNVSPTRYWDMDTGALVGHGYSGALSYVFAPDGTYKRYFYLETRLYGDVSGIFSASEGTVIFTGDTFALKPTKGTYRFTEGKKLKKERPMDQGELERPGLTFSYKLKSGEQGAPALVVGGAGGETRDFSRSKDSN